MADKFALPSLDQPDPLGQVNKLVGVAGGIQNIRASQQNVIQSQAATAEIQAALQKQQMDNAAASYGQAGQILMVGTADPTKIDANKLRLDVLNGVHNNLIIGNVGGEIGAAITAHADDPAWLAAYAKQIAARGQSFVPNQPVLGEAGSAGNVSAGALILGAGAPGAPAGVPGPAPGAPPAGAPGAPPAPVSDITPDGMLTGDTAAHTLGLTWMPPGEQIHSATYSDLPAGAVRTKFPDYREPIVAKANVYAAGEENANNRKALLQTLDQEAPKIVHGEQISGAFYNVVSNLAPVFGIDTTSLSADEVFKKTAAQLQQSGALNASDMQRLQTIEANPKSEQTTHTIRTLTTKMMGVEDMVAARARFYAHAATLGPKQMQDADLFWQRNASDPVAYQALRLQKTDPVEFQQLMAEQARTGNYNKVRKQIGFLMANPELYSEGE